MPLLEAERQETHAIATLDGWCWLLGMIRQALEPITPTGRLVSVSESKATVETAIALLKQLVDAADGVGAGLVVLVVLDIWRIDGAIMVRVRKRAGSPCGSPSGWPAGATSMAATSLRSAIK